MSMALGLSFQLGDVWGLVVMESWGLVVLWSYPLPGLQVEPWSCDECCGHVHVVHLHTVLGCSGAVHG